VSVGLRVHVPRFSRPIPAKPVPIARPYPIVRRRSSYDRWVGLIVIASVLLFCVVMGLAGLNLIQSALHR
jgi:hypothetical protein